MIDVKVDREEPALLHDQVAAQIRRAIADGEARPGERLPCARHLAAVMHISTNSVLRALRLLRDEGLLEPRPGHGIRVTGTPQRGALVAKAIELVTLARETGYTRAELHATSSNARRESRQRRPLGPTAAQRAGGSGGGGDHRRTPRRLARPRERCAPARGYGARRAICSRSPRCVSASSRSTACEGTNSTRVP